MKVIIIGAGPAGSTAAIQLWRFGFDVELIERNRIGGLLQNANLIENYLGFPEGISGEMFCELIKEQIYKFGINVFFDEVMKIEFIDNKIIVNLTKDIKKCDICIVATGTKPIQLSKEIIEEEARKYVFYEISNIKHYTNNCKVAVLGSGDAAFDYAISLSMKNTVSIIMRGDTPKAIRTLVDSCNKINNISLEKNIQLIKIIRINDKLLLNCIKDRELVNFEVDYLIVAIGREKNLPEISEKALKTDRLFLIGDVATEKNIRQASIAAGHGMEAAINVYLKNWNKL